MTNYNKCLLVISKWPVAPSAKTFNYGYYLRQLLKNKDLEGNIFPGNAAETTKKLDSLKRLTFNTYSKKYPTNKAVGASGLSVEHLNQILSEEFMKFTSK